MDEELSFQFTHPGGVRRSRLVGGFGSHMRFNSRTREGCDAKAGEDAMEGWQFQFTHPGGVRLLLEIH